jgi:predicted ATP-dependent protease
MGGPQRTLKDGVLKIEELGAKYSLISTVKLDPEPVPARVKVVLIGSPMLHYFLYAYDKDFQKLFKVKVDFTTRMPRDAESKRAYGLFVNTIACWEKLPPFDASVVARCRVWIAFGRRAGSALHRFWLYRKLDPRSRPAPAR